MRVSALFFGAAMALLLFATSSHAGDVSLIWTTTTGTGTVGGSDITAVPGDTLTLAIRVTPDASGIREISISIDFDPTALSLNSASEVGSATLTGPFSPGLTTTATPPPTGDCDGDGAVGISDYVQYLNTFALLVAPGTGCDFDGNGIIGFPPPGELPAIIGYYQFGSPTAPTPSSPTARYPPGWH